MSVDLTGVVICLVGSTSIALGLVLQKLSHERNALSECPVSFTRQPWWIVGFVVFLIGQILNLVAMGMLSQLVLSCLGGYALIANAVFARCILGEMLRPVEILAMLGVVLGIVVVISCTPAVSDSAWDIDMMIAALCARTFLCTCVALGVVMVCTFSLARSRTELKPVAWALLSSICGGYSVMFFKDVSLLASAAAAGTAQPWLDYRAYCLLVAGLCCGSSQIHTLNVALQMGEAVMVVPIFYVMGMLAQLLTGAVYFDELQAFKSNAKLQTFFAAVAALVVCIFVQTASKIWAETAEADDIEHQNSLDDKATALITPVLSPVGASNGHMVDGAFAGAGSGQSLWREMLMHRARSSNGTLSPTSCCSRKSSLDFGAFPDSFPGGQRRYIVSVVGQMGIA
eukprot:TRINITY_DN39437_c0_g1_i1.p1 TRINITY_DN39437_c0_g1~~TRINITY_DN39437_c0_g1_i1.p1  ORF type:complete len:406 (-),score=76.76 TRINITY_DN39437_c0_g1_i1:81-1277(-)